MHLMVLNLDKGSSFLSENQRCFYFLDSQNGHNKGNDMPVSKKCNAENG